MPDFAIVRELHFQLLRQRDRLAAKRFRLLVLTAVHQQPGETRTAENQLTAVGTHLGMFGDELLRQSESLSQHLGRLLWAGPMQRASFGHQELGQLIAMTRNGRKVRCQFLPYIHALFEIVFGLLRAAVRRADFAEIVVTGSQLLSKLVRRVDNKLLENFCFAAAGVFCLG